MLGFVVGWVLRGDGGRAVVLPPATSQETSTATTATIGTTPRPARPVAPPVDRSGVAVAVLNASNVTGLAGQTGDRAVRLGYTRANLVVGNAPPQSGGSVVYYRSGSRSQARQVAKDLEVGRVAPIPANTSLTGQTPGAAQSDVIVVLASG